LTVTVANTVVSVTTANTNAGDLATLIATTYKTNVINDAWTTVANTNAVIKRWLRLYNYPHRTHYHMYMWSMVTINNISS